LPGPQSDSVSKAVIDAYVAANHSKAGAAKLLGLGLTTFCSRFDIARRRGFKIPAKSAPNPQISRIRQLSAALEEAEEHNKKLAKEAMTAEKVKRLIHGCDIKFKPPTWLSKKAVANTRGVPTFFASDWHLDEVVQPSQVNYVNAFNRQIATTRARHFIDTGIDLVTQHLARAKYDYCVFALGGDMLSGNIHEELRETNEHPIHKSLLYAADLLIAAITKLHDTFGQVYVPVVVGNHGRLSRKPIYKNRAFENYDWLLAQIVARHFAGEPAIRFEVGDGSELFYRVHGTRYFLQHGDDFIGGSGISGPFTPWMLGDLRKRRRQDAINQPYDVLIMGHWHQYTPLRRLIVNGTLKGFDEYAKHKGYEFELPTQAVWVTHPEHGITVHWPVFLEPPGKTFH